MRPRPANLAIVVAGIALVLAQLVTPEWPGFHEWPYALALAVAAAAALRGLRAAPPSTALGLLGALVMLAAGLASGLLGPDSESVIRAPGTVAPLPPSGVAAFFPDAQAADIAAGHERVTIRRATGPAVTLGLGDRQYSGATVLSLEPRLAAFLEARDLGGRRLTITQPTNPAFLSQLALFPGRVAVAGKVLPADGFATPALRRQIKIFYFSRDDAPAGGGPALLCVVDDDGGHAIRGGIGFVRSGASALIGGVRLHATLGTYPAIVISAVPYPPALVVGALFAVGGAAFRIVRKSRAVTEVTSNQSPGAM